MEGSITYERPSRLQVPDSAPAAIFRALAARLARAAHGLAAACTSQATQPRGRVSKIPWNDKDTCNN